MGLAGWYVLHRVASCASVVGAAIATGGLESPIFIVTEDVPVTISCGVTIASRDVNLRQAIQLADEAMYTAKRNGRDRTVMLDRHARGGAAAEK